MKLEGSIVIVTGAGRGLGKTFAEILSKEGCKTIICSRNEKELQETQKGIAASGGKCEYFVVDVSKPAEVGKFVDDVISSHGRIDVLINNAGWCHDQKPIEKITDLEYHRSFQANVDSVFYFLRKIIPMMKKQGSGVIINISSGAGLYGRSGLSMYAASKAALNNITVSVSKEVENTSVACVALCLMGGFNTPMRTEIFGKEDAESRKDPKIIAGYIKDMLLGKIPFKNGNILEVPPKPEVVR